jgi:hypothetical protein
MHLSKNSETLTKVKRNAKQWEAGGGGGRKYGSSWIRVQWAGEITERESDGEHCNTGDSEHYGDIKETRTDSALVRDRFCLG